MPPARSLPFASDKPPQSQLHTDTAFDIAGPPEIVCTMSEQAVDSRVALLLVGSLCLAAFASKQCCIFKTSLCLIAARLHFTPLLHVSHHQQQHTPTHVGPGTSCYPCLPQCCCCCPVAAQVRSLPRSPHKVPRTPSRQTPTRSTALRALLSP